MELLPACVSYPNLNPKDCGPNLSKHHKNSKHRRVMKIVAHTYIIVFINHGTCYSRMLTHHLGFRRAPMHNSATNTQFGTWA